MSSTISGLSEVVKKLYELQCCARCVLRYIGVQESASFYARPYQEIVKYVEAEYGSLPSAQNENSPTCASYKEVICVTCLGLLQQHSTTTLVKQICDAVKSSEHEYFNFTTSVFFPLVLSFRHHSMWLYLKEQFGSIYPEQIKFGGILRLKDCFKFVYGPRIEQNLEIEFSKMSPFTITVMLNHFEAMKELNFLAAEKRALKCHPRKRKKCLENEPAITSAQVTTCNEGLRTCEEFNKVGQCPPNVVTTYCEITSVECTNASVYLAGRYNKYSRTLSQSPWIVNGERMTPDSVEELIAKEIKKVFLPDETKFSSAGREDVDVRMLGTGRPFILELINPRKVSQTAQQIKDLQARVNKSTEDIQIKDLQKITREDCSKLKDAENSKTKSYSALVYVLEGVTNDELQSLNDLKDVTLNQKTPIRVLHRRTLADRQRTILSMSTEYLDNQHFRLHLCTQAGTYIKEFVHGDFGRTKPNLTTIMSKETDILELDVTSVDVDWPPSIEP